MEFADYIRIVKKNLLMIVVVTVLFGLAAGIVTARQDTSYQASTSIEIARLQSVDQNKVGYFQYDDFYATQVATTFSDNVVGWLASPAMVAEIFQKAGYDLPSGNLKDLGKVFTAKKNVATSTVIVVNYFSTDYNKSEKLIATAAQVLKTKIEGYNSSASSAKFSVDVTTPVVIASPKPTALNTVIAAVVGLFISFGVAFLGESLKK